MKEIFQEYGGILITVVAILAVIVVITAVIGKDEMAQSDRRLCRLSTILLRRRMQTQGYSK